MKTAIIESYPDKTAGIPPTWYFLPDSALCNAGKPFFLPDGDDTVEALFVPVFKLSRLGKSIPERFADRYVGEIAPGIHFRISGLRNRLLSLGLPPDISHSFDRSLIMADSLPLDKALESDLDFEFVHNGTVLSSWKLEDGLREACSMISSLSGLNTVKTGDCVVAQIPAKTGIHIGDRLEIRRGDEVILFVNIK